MTKNQKLEAFKKLCKDNAPLAVAVLQAQAYAEMMREKVDKYTLPIFQKYTFHKDPKFIREGESTLIETENELYLTDLDSPEYLQYMEEVKNEHVKQGWKGNREFCPALVAENLRMEAENHLIKAFAKHFGVDGVGMYGENRKKFLKLIMGASMKAAREEGLI